MASVRPLRVAFIHPDLGIGGAERLIVDAACGLKDLGHDVCIYTSHWDPERCFKETRDGTLDVTVLGDSLPISFRNKFFIIFAILRQLHLAFTLLYRTYFSSSFIPPDIYIVDQLSTCIPVLRWFAHTRVIFYCHFPDLLLSPGRGGFENGMIGRERKSLLRSVYRIPIDALEEATTGQADRILVNSNYTATIFRSIFPHVRRQLQIVYPGIKSKDYQGPAPALDNDIVSSRPTLLSINRFEAKKNVALAIKAFANAIKSSKIPENARLVIAGGFDERVANCVHTLRHLQRICDDIGLSHSTDSQASQVLFLTNISEKQKLALLKSESTKALLYTPSFEHLGIVPLEAMACGLPVLAVDNGGPQETIIDGQTGLLRPAVEDEWTEAITTLMNLSPEQRSEMSKAGQQRIKDYFEVKVLARAFEKAARDVVEASETGQIPDIWTETSTLKAAMFVALSTMCCISLVALMYHAGVF